MSLCQVQQGTSWNENFLKHSILLWFTPFYQNIFWDIAKMNIYTKTETVQHYTRGLEGIQAVLVIWSQEGIKFYRQPQAPVIIHQWHTNQDCTFKSTLSMRSPRTKNFGSPAGTAACMHLHALNWIVSCCECIKDGTIIHRKPSSISRDGRIWSAILSWQRMKDLATDE